MKYSLFFISLLSCCFCATAQTPITAVITTTTTAPSTYTYSNGGNTYNWGVSPNNSVVTLTGFTAGGVAYTYAAALTGSVKLKRVNNASVTGNFTLVWAETVTNGTIFNMVPNYQNDMETFFTNRIYNKGTDNFFDNTSSNSNNIERMDWILSNSFSTPIPGQFGFAIFERGAVGAHDPFCIAAITSLDGSGNPATYGNIVRVATANYGEPGPAVNYRILKALTPADLLDAGTASQNRGGVFITTQALGIGANVPFYGYSLFSSDLPVGATPANLVDYTNATYFPTNTGNPGGIDLIAITGISISNLALPTRFTSFNAVENNSVVNLKWTVENETSVNKYEIERSTDGINYSKINEMKNTATTTGANTYYFPDNVSGILSDYLYYRVKQYDHDATYYYSKTISIRRNNKNAAVIIYPNPASETLYINIANTANDKGTITVINSSGARISLQQVQLTNGNNSFTVEGIGRLPVGVYQLSIKLDSGRLITKRFSKN